MQGHQGVVGAAPLGDSKDYLQQPGLIGRGIWAQDPAASLRRQACLVDAADLTLAHYTGVTYLASV